MMENLEVTAEKQNATADARASGIRWWRVLIAGIAAEVAVMIVAVPTLWLPNPQQVLNIAIGPASFVAMAIFGYWAARPALRLQALHGLLTGAVGVLLYVGMMLAGSSAPGAPPGAFAATLTPAYLLAHVLKLLGGWIGGVMAARSSRRT